MNYFDKRLLSGTGEIVSVPMLLCSRERTRHGLKNREVLEAICVADVVLRACISIP